MLLGVVTTSQRMILDLLAQPLCKVRRRASHEYLPKWLGSLLSLSKTEPEERLHLSLSCYLLWSSVYPFPFSFLQ